MQHNILWTGREYFSLENCRITMTPTGAEIHSTIIGYYQGRIYQVDYFIETNKQWHTLLLDLTATEGDNIETVLLISDGKGNWKYNGTPADQFKGCLEVDIPLTPFTNTLPIRRLNLSAGKSSQIDVIYCDVLAHQIGRVQQKYTRLSTTKFHYENIPNDFEATIVVDDIGLVIDYPELFVRTASNHNDTEHLYATQESMH